LSIFGFQKLQMPFFSIVIPLYNKERFIGSTLESIIKQGFTDFEAIVVNDGSTDNSEKIVQNFNDSRIRYFLQDNAGVSSARNFGIEKASSNYVCFLDADDIWHSDFLEVMYQYILKFPRQKVFASAFEIETSKAIFNPKYSVKKTADFEIVNYFEASTGESVIWTSAVVIEKSVFESTGMFDPKVRISEDTDLWIRIGLQFPVLFIWKVLARYVYDEKSVSRDSGYLFQSESFEKYFEEEKQHPALKKFMDLNRFSAAIKSRLIGDKLTYEKYYSEINRKNLKLKKRILLELPVLMLRILIRFKTFKANIGLGNSVFK